MLPRKQRLLNLAVHAGKQFRVVGKVLPVRRHHGFQAAFPVFQAACKAFLQHFQHDGNGSGCPWRCAEQGGKAAILGVDDFGAKLQAAVFGGGVFDDLHALPCLCQFPIFFAGIGDKFAQFLERCSLLSNTCPIRYWVRVRFLMPAVSMVRRLCGLSEAGKSQIEPCFRNLVVKPAKGPNNKAFLPSI